MNTDEFEDRLERCEPILKWSLTTRRSQRAAFEGVVFPLPVENGLRWAVLFLYL
jgi:hypothetical protein